MTIQVTDAMVSRFLAWRLPDDFAPDGGVTFDPSTPRRHNSWPIGTNLLHVAQARAMLEHVLAEEQSQAIDLGEVTGTAPDLRPTASTEAATLGEAKAEQQTAHQLSATSRTGTAAQQLRVTGHTIEAVHAPKVTSLHVEAAIASEHYFTAEDGMMGSVKCDPLDPARPSLSQVTFCVLVLMNGTKVVGINYGSIDPAQHNAERGRADARADAIRRVWPLLGYALRERLAGGA